jgi:branched-subunit amino acid transport protein
MSALDSWLVVLGLAIGTFLIRYSFIGLFANRDMPSWLTRWLQLTVPAIFATIVASGIAITGGQFGGWALWPRYAAGFIAFLVAWRTQGNVLTTVICGMVALHLMLLLQTKL